MKKKRKTQKEFIPVCHIGRRIKAIMDTQGMNRLELSKLTGIHNETIYRLFSGRGGRKWRLQQHLEKVASALKVSLADLVEDRVLPVGPPMVGKIKAGVGPPHAAINQGAGMNYSLEVEDRSLMDTYPPGTILFARRKSAETIQSGNHVVHWDDDGNIYIRQLFFNHEHIILRSLTQGIPDKVLPKIYISMCDNIVEIKPPSLKSPA